MAKHSDDTLLLVLSDKEASVLRNIIEPPALTDDRIRLLKIAAAVLVVLGLIGLALFHPRLARTIAETIALLAG